MEMRAGQPERPEGIGASERSVISSRDATAPDGDAGSYVPLDERTSLIRLHVFQNLKDAVVRIHESLLGHKYVAGCAADFAASNIDETPSISLLNAACTIRLTHFRAGSASL